MTISKSSIIQDQIDLLQKLDKFSDMFGDGILTFEHRLEAYNSFHNLFPAEFKAMFGSFNPQDLKRVDSDSQVIIFHPHFNTLNGEWNYLKDLWEKHVYDAGLARSSIDD